MPEKQSRTADERPDGPAARAVLTAEEFGEMFRAAGQSLWCIAAAVTGDRHRAEDIVQDAAAIALGKLDQFDPGTSFTAWMGQIVRYTALNRRRRIQRRRTAPVDPQIMDESTAGSVAIEGAMRNGAAVTHDGRLALDQAAFDDDVVRGLNALDERTRCCILLRVVMELPYRDIALAMDIPEGTAMSCVHRGRKALCDMLQPDEGASP